MNYSGMNLSGRILNEIQLSEQDLKNTNFSGSRLIGADLSYANLENADLSGADLTSADLTGANLSGAVLSNTILSRAILIGTILEDVGDESRKEDRLQIVRRKLPKVMILLKRQLSSLRPQSIEYTFQELREVQKRILGKTSKEMLVGEYFTLPNNQELRIVKLESKNGKTYYLVITSLTDYYKGKAEISKGKKFLKFKDAFRYYRKTKREIQES
jgi:uncharacterized protein YjbI with pentapeptide repeats